MGAPAPRNEGASFNVGDDVVHAVHGDGVVIGVEADVVVVRFRGDGSERKLMVDYAPLKKA
jgi:DNA helicase-2/ATP-dependent DNA helicase PcrA